MTNASNPRFGELEGLAITEFLSWERSLSAKSTLASGKPEWLAQIFGFIGDWGADALLELPDVRGYRQRAADYLADEDFRKRLCDECRNRGLLKVADQREKLELVSAIAFVYNPEPISEASDTDFDPIADPQVISFIAREIITRKLESYCADSNDP